MTHVTVPLTESLLAYIDEHIDSHRADSRAGFIRRLIAAERERELLQAHLEALDEYKKRKTLRGDLRRFRRRI